MIRVLFSVLTIVFNLEEYVLRLYPIIAITNDGIFDEIIQFLVFEFEKNQTL
jgi:hypothetical protein